MSVRGRREEGTLGQSGRRKSTWDVFFILRSSLASDRERDCTASPAQVHKLLILSFHR